MASYSPSYSFSGLDDQNSAYSKLTQGKSAADIATEVDNEIISRKRRERKRGKNKIPGLTRGATKGAGRGTKLQGYGAMKNAGMGRIPGVTDPSLQAGGGGMTMTADVDYGMGEGGGRKLAQGVPGEFNSGPYKGMTRGQAYNQARSDAEMKVSGPTKTAVYSPTGEILSTGTGKQIRNSNLVDAGSADVRRARMDQFAMRREANARGAVAEARQKQQDDREYENMQIAQRGYLTKDGVTRFYSDEDRKAAEDSASLSQRAQERARTGGDMDVARAEAKGSMSLDRSSAPSSQGRATIVRTDPRYTPFGSPGYGVGGVKLTDNPESDSKTRWGDSMSLSTAKDTLKNGTAAIPGLSPGMQAAVADVNRKTAGDRVGAAIRDTMVSEMNKSGGIPGLTSPEAQAKKRTQEMRKGVEEARAARMFDRPV
jgi:hypothetical protein